MSAPDDAQTDFVDYLDDSFDYAPLMLANSATSPRVTSDILSEWGMDVSWLGKQSHQVPGDIDFYRYQFDKIFFYPIKRTSDDESEVGWVEFRTYINYVGPVPRRLRDHIRDHDNARLRTLFDSGPYSDPPPGWLSGFNFHKHASNVENNVEIGADEAGNLGIPQFEVGIYDEYGDEVSDAAGFFDPFALLERPPQQEAWRVTFNSARRSYEIRPQAGARQRLMGKQKEVYVNGHYIGSTVPTRGTVWLKRDYGTNDETYKDRVTGMQMYSREKLKQTGMHPQGLRDGGKVYKVEETAERIFLVSTKPQGFAPTRGEDVDPSQATMLDFATTTEFLVRHDHGPKLGKYTPPVVRSIEYETDWNTEPA